MKGNPEAAPVNVTKEISVPNEDTLSSQRLVGLVIGSYAFSQGLEPVQRRVFDYYHYLHPHYRITHDLLVQTIRPLQTRVSKIVGSEGHRRISDEKIRWEPVERLRDLQASFERPALEPEEGETVIIQLARDSVLTDFGYLCLDEGRPKEPIPGTPYNPFQDKYISYTSYFALERDETGNPLHPQGLSEIAQLYQRIGDHILSDADLGDVNIDDLSSYHARGWQDYNSTIRYVVGKLRKLGIHAVEGTNDRVNVRDLLSEVQLVHNNRPTEW